MGFLMFKGVFSLATGGSLALVLATGLLAIGPEAAAATLNHGRFDRAALPDAHDARSTFLSNFWIGNLHIETFDGYAAWDGSSGTSDPSNTNVGHFSSLGGHGTGHSAINGGRTTEVRGDNDMRWGRYHADSQGTPLVAGNWLDSNDTFGIRWDIEDLGHFNLVAFFLTDAADVGATFSLMIGDTSFADVAGGVGRLANGNVHFVWALLPGLVDSLTVQMMHDELNDGFGIDGVTIAHVAPIPAPPAAALLLTGVVGLLGLGRRLSARRGARSA